MVDGKLIWFERKGRRAGRELLLSMCVRAVGRVGVFAGAVTQETEETISRLDARLGRMPPLPFLATPQPFSPPHHHHLLFRTR